MKNNFKFLLISGLFGVLAIVTIGLTSYQTNQEIASLVDTTQKTGAVAGVAEKGNASLVINFGDKTKEYQWSVDQNTTAWELVNRAAIRENLIIKTTALKNVGLMIESINDYVNGDNNLFWIYYVNGQMADTAIDKTFVKPGDKIELNFIPYPY